MAPPSRSPEAGVEAPPAVSADATPEQQLTHALAIPASAQTRAVQPNANAEEQPTEKPDVDTPQQTCPDQLLEGPSSEVHRRVRDLPRAAVDLARWISAPFAVWMDGWFLESVQQAQPAPVETTAPRLREAEVITLVERSIVVFERPGGLDERDQLLFKDIVRSNVLTASSGLLPGAPTDEELTLGDAWLEVFQPVLPRSQFCSAGTLVARAYREEFGEAPPCRQQFVDGAPRQVKSYRRCWLVETLQRFCAQLAGG